MHIAHTYQNTMCVATVGKFSEDLPAASYSSGPISACGVYCASTARLSIRHELASQLVGSKMICTQTSRAHLTGDGLYRNVASPSYLFTNNCGDFHMGEPRLRCIPPEVLWGFLGLQVRGFETSDQARTITGDDPLDIFILPFHENDLYPSRRQKDALQAVHLGQMSTETREMLFSTSYRFLKYIWADDGIICYKTSSENRNCWIACYEEDFVF